MGLDTPHHHPPNLHISSARGAQSFCFTLFYSLTIKIEPSQIAFFLYYIDNIYIKT